MLAQLAVILIGFHYGSLLASISRTMRVRPSMRVIPSIRIIESPSPPPKQWPHPCVQCQQWNRTTERWEAQLPFLPLQACGYGADNFSWVEWSRPDVDDPFDGLGINRTKKPPKKDEVYRRARELQKIWDPNFSGEFADRKMKVTTGLNKVQAEAIRARIYAMEAQARKVLELMDEAVRKGELKGEWNFRMWRMYTWSWAARNPGVEKEIGQWKYQRLQFHDDEPMLEPFFLRRDGSWELPTEQLWESHDIWT
ncbi:hypothetical protein NA57DRAFT_56668 [Rhizodiscina lignyota]|uniref:Uncharacterized protein n=1 Tax=Rhizodiscina lignyota TaxID=1504668 RepID=A0A9P4MAT6_9PEZI|nr:hypothetical protein NA57DRAFT_56668 [Rhizodiscina lignyota]